MPAVPYVNRFTAPSEDERAARHAEIERLQRQHQERTAALAPARRAALEAGPPLRDLEAAVRCQCGCHPRPAEPSLHDGGVTCSCQATDAERAAARDALLVYLAELGESPIESLIDRESSSWADELGIELISIGGAAPFVVRGRCDGRGFYLRERHDLWRVEIAPDDDATADPWGLDPYASTIIVAEGSSSDFETDGRFDPKRALEVAVDSVRLFLARRDCAHPGAERFCPHCGVDMREASRWRLTSDSG